MADAITWSVTFSGSSGLTFDNSSASYRLLPGTGLAELSARRTLVVAPDIHGAAETSNALDEGTYVLAVRCLGGSWSGAVGLSNALFNAARQRSYTLAVTIDGLTETWTCRAMSRFAAPIGAELSWSHIREVTLSIPVYPIPA